MRSLSLLDMAMDLDLKISGSAVSIAPNPPHRLSFPGPWYVRSSSANDYYPDGNQLPIDSFLFLTTKLSDPERVAGTNILSTCNAVSVIVHYLTATLYDRTTQCGVVVLVVQ